MLLADPACTESDYSMIISYRLMIIGPVLLRHRLPPARIVALAVSDAGWYEVGRRLLVSKDGPLVG
jgi:hypothetical protein